jgi:membrane-bound serine protease (ClpP class)
MLGAVLMGLELFVIPGFGIAGIAGLLCVAAGMIFSLQDFVIPDPAFPWEADLLVKNITMVLASCIFAFIISLSLLRYVLPKISKVISGPYLDATLEDSHADSKESQRATIGDEGTAMTFLRPSGKMKIGNNVFDVITEGEFLEKGTAIVIADIKGNRVIVSKKDIEKV